MADIIIPTYNEIMTDLQNGAKEQFWTTFSTDITSQWYQLMAPISLLIRTKYEMLLDEADKRDVYKAEGYDLDALLSGNFNFPRKQASASTGTWTSTNSTAGTAIAIGDITFTTDDDVTFTNTEAQTVDDTGTIAISIECDSTGEIGNVNSGTITKVLTPVSGIGTGSNLSDISDGQDTESDYEYRYRYLESGSISSTWNIDALKSTLLELDGVESVSVFENDTTETDSIGVPQKSIFVVIYGGNDSDIADTIFQNSDHAIYRHGDVSIAITSLSGQDITVRFSRPTEVTIEYELTITGSYDSSEITQTIEDYINDTGINGLLSEYQCTKLINDETDTDNIETLQLAFRRSDTGGDYYSTLQMGETEKAVI